MSHQRDRDRFLDLIPPATRSHITNLFLQAVREGAESPDEVLSSVVITIGARLAEIRDTSWSREEEPKFQGYLDVIREHQDRALGMALWALWWQSLSPNEKARLKSKKAIPHIHRWMKQRPPSAGQIGYLRDLGCYDTPETMADASDLIDHLTRKRAGRR